MILIVGLVKIGMVCVLEECVDMELYSGFIILNTVKSAKKGVTAARNVLKFADVV